MPMVRYQIRNEYALADPELYRAADKDDPEALLEGVAMAGLVGVLRQLGDLAEFAAEIFHELHEEVMATAARGHGLMLRVQQLEAEVPSIEKAFLSQCRHLQFTHNAGTEWHSNIRIDQNLITRGDMPRFILDSYEECRGPPRLFMLDKFDIAGAGACLKRYSDPSFFKSELASSGILDSEVQKEKRARKVKKKVSRWRNGGAVESSLIMQINSNLQQVPEKNPVRRVKLKDRHVTGMDGSRSRSYMEILLEEYSPKEKVLEDLGQSTKSVNLSISAPEVHEILIDNLDKYSSSKEERNPSHPPIRQTTEMCSHELQNQKANSGEFFETLPEPFRESKKLFSTFQIAEKNEMLVCNEGKTEGSIDSYSSIGVGKDTPALNKSSQADHFAETESITKRFADGYRSDDIGSEVENFMDALNTMESEIETDSENKPKSDQGFSKGERGISETYKGQKDLLFKISEPEYVQDSATSFVSKSVLPEGISKYGICSLASTDAPNQNMIKSDIPSEELHQTIEVAEIKPITRSLFDGHCSTETSDIPNIRPEIGEASDQSMINSDVPSNFEIILDETHDRAFEELHKTNEVAEIKLTTQSLFDGHFNTESDIPNITSEIGEISSDSCVTDSNSTIVTTRPQGSFGEARSVTLELKESFCHLKNDCKVAEDYDHNIQCTKESSQARQSDDLSIGRRDLHGLVHSVDHGEELLSEDMTIEMLRPLSLKQDGTIHEQIAPKCSEDLLLQELESRKHSMEDSGGSMSSTTSIVYPVMSSVVVMPGGLPAGRESSVQPECLAVEMPPRSLTGSLEVDKNLDGSSFGGANIAGSAHPTKDGAKLEEVADINDMHDDLSQSQRGVILEKIPTRYFEDLSLPMTMHIGDSQQSDEYDTDACSERRISTNSPVVSPARSHIGLQLTDIDEEIQNSVVFGERFPCAQPAVNVKNSDDSFKSDSLVNNVVMHVMECLSDVDEPRESYNVEAAFVPKCSVKETFSSGMELLSDHEVISGPQTVCDDLRRLSVSKASDVDENTEQAEEPNRCDHEVIIEPPTVGGDLGWLSVSKVSDINEYTVQTEGPNRCDHEVITEPQAVGGGLRWPPVCKASDIEENTVQNEGPNRCDHEVITETVSGGLRWLSVCKESEIDENTMHTGGHSRCDHEMRTEPQTVGGGLRWLSVSKVSDTDENTMQTEGPNPCDDPINDVNVEALADCTETSSSFSSGSMQLQLNHEVIDETQTVAGGLRLPSGYKVSDIDEDAMQTEESIQCDDSMNDVTAEAVTVCTETHSRFPYELHDFSKQFQEDCVLSSADLDQHELEISESTTMNNNPILNSESILPVSRSFKDESCSPSARAFPDSEFPYPDFADPSDPNLLNGFYRAMLHDSSRRDLHPCINEDISIHLLQERDLNLKASTPFARESAEKDISSSIQPLVQDKAASKTQAGDGPTEMSSNQEVELLDPSVQSEIACFATGDDSVNLNEKPSEPELDPHTMIYGRNISELDIPLPEAGTGGQLVSEVSVPSQCDSEHLVNSFVPNVSALELELSEGIGPSIYESDVQQLSEPQISCPVLSFQLQGVQEAPPLPPLPPLEWRIGKLELDPLTSDRNLVQPMAEIYPFLASSIVDRKCSALAEANSFSVLPATEDRLYPQDKMGKPLRLSELPPIVEDKGYQFVSQGETVLSLNPSSPRKGDEHLNSFDASWGIMFDPSNPFVTVQSPEYGDSQNHRIHGENVQPSDNKLPPLSKLLPALELERFQYGVLHIDSEIAQPASSCLTASPTVNDEYIYSFGGNVGENMQHLSLTAPLSTAVPMIPCDGFVSSRDECQFTQDDSFVPIMEDEKPNGKFSSIRNRPRHPFIDAVAAHDKSKLRKVSELAPPSTKPKVDERNTLLEQIRNKSFNLKPAAMAKPNVKGPSTNLKVAAILEKANAIRQACAGSDEDDDGNWSDS